MDKNTGESAGAGAQAGGQAGGGSGYLWLGGAAAGLAAGAVLWFVALGPMEPPVAEAPKDAGAAPVAAVTPDAAVEPAAPATTVASAAPAAEPAIAEPVASDEAAASTTEPAPVDASVAAPAPAVVSPTFDTVRAEADGTVLVAGRAAPGAEVAVMADGAEVGRATADSAGQFVTFLSMGSSAVARVLTLTTTAADGAVTVADASVILSPTPELEVAAAEPASESAPAATEPASTEPATTEPATTEPATTEIAAATEPAAPQVLIADSNGVRKLAPGAATSIVIDTIAYSAAGEVQLAGRAAGGGTARIYLDNAQAGEGPIGEGGAWAVTLPGIAAGRYTLRVDQVGADGKVTSRFETPFQREAPEVVAAATQAQPATTATVTEVAPDTTTAEVAPDVTETATPTVTPEPATVATVAPAATEAATAPKPADATDVPPITTATVVTVQPGFTLWQIARENYGDGMLYVKVFEANKNLIRNPDLIYPGQLFTVPKGN